MATMKCQKCRTPLKLDSSLEALNPAAFNLLVGSATSSQQAPKSLSPSRPAYPPERKALYDRVSRDATSTTFSRALPSSISPSSSSTAKNAPGSNPAMSFVMLSSSEVVPPSLVPSAKVTQSSEPQPYDGTMALDDETKAMSHEMARIAHLFEILTSRSDIDHPICTECTALLLSTLEARLEASVRERDAYANYLKELRSTAPTESEIASAKVAYEKARSGEETAMKELLELEAQRKAVDAEIADLTLESQQLDIAETEFWESHNAFTGTLSSHLAQRASAAAQLAHDSTQLSKLQRTNVYNDTFNISHDGTFGTINGLRLGRLSTVMVDWPEINAAWGQTLLLLSTVAKRLGFTFKNYELVPMGSTSQIIALTPARRAGQPPKRVVLDLYTSGDMPLGLTFMHRHFDSAMSAFLECLAQVGAFVERETAREGRGLRLPYQIDGDRIGGFSIRLGVSQDDGWGSACKFVLTCCKFLLAHASNVASTGGGRGR